MPKDAIVGSYSSNFIFIFKNNCLNWFPVWFTCYSLLWPVFKWSCFSVSSLAFVTVTVFNFSHSDKYVVMIYYVLKIFLFLAALGLLCYKRAFSSCGSQPSHCSGFFCHRAQALGHSGFSSCDKWGWSLWHLGLVALRHLGDPGFNFCFLHWQADS